MVRITGRRIGIAAVLALFWALTLICFTDCAGAKEITDMAGRRIAVPDSINKVYVPSPYGSYLMYTVDPAMLIGLNLSHKEDKKYLPKEAQNLPVIGGLSGQGMQSNMEQVLKAKPDLIVMWSARKPVTQGRMDETFKQLNLPIVYAVAESMDDYPDVYLFMGRLLNREDRTKKLAAYCRKTLTDVRTAVARVPKEKRPKVYYAEGIDGLSTECNDSIHVELLALAGDVDVHRCHTSSHKGMEKMSVEQVMLYNPDIIVAQEKAFFDKVYDDPVWRNVKAVKDRKVYLIPRAPFNWFDRPPSFMRFLGLKWLVNHLYPNEYKLDVTREAQAFYKLFLGVDLSDEEMKKVIYR